MKQRARLLKQMGITQWVPRHPGLLQGEHGVTISESTQLVIISDAHLDLDQRLLNDIFLALNVSSTEVVCLTFSEFARVPSLPACRCWVLGTETESDMFKGAFITPVLDELQANQNMKRDFWKQIVQYDQHYTP